MRPFSAFFRLWYVLPMIYLDPSSGSMMLQIILGGLAGAAVAFKLFFRRVRAFFGKAEPAEPESAETPDGV